MSVAGIIERKPEKPDEDTQMHLGHSPTLLYAFPEFGGRGLGCFLTLSHSFGSDGYPPDDLSMNEDKSQGCDTLNE